MNMLFRPLYERWLLQAAEGPLAPWQRSLLKRALADDEALRCLALEILEFQNELQAKSSAPDLSARLGAQARVDLIAEEERPLFPSAWLPAGALAALLLVALLILWQPGPQVTATVSKGSDGAAALALPTAEPTASPTPTKIAEQP